MDDPVSVVDAAMVRIRRSIVQRRLSKVLLRELPEADLAAIAVVDAIDQVDDRASVGDVAALLGVDPSAASRRVAQAVAAGLVERVAHQDDGRRVSLVVSAAGRRLGERVAARRRDRFARALAGLDDAERERFATLLTAFVDGLDDAYTER